MTWGPGASQKTSSNKQQFFFENVNLDLLVRWLEKSSKNYSPKWCFLIVVYHGTLNKSKFSWSLWKDENL